jgi:hypothetical protein
VRPNGADHLLRAPTGCGLLELFEKRKVAMVPVAESLDTIERRCDAFVVAVRHEWSHPHRR